MGYYVYQKWSCMEAGDVSKKELWKDSKKVRKTILEKLM